MQEIAYPAQDSISATRLAELLCTRLCHDITGPIGAVNNGVEFLSSEGEEFLADATALIASSAAQAVSRLQFFRYCYGRIKHKGEVNLQDLRQLSLDFFSEPKITLDWSAQYLDSHTYSLPVRCGRILVNLLLIMSETLVRGGTLTVTLEHSPRAIDIHASGETIKTESIEAVFQGKVRADELDPKQSQLWMTLLLASELKLRMHYAHDDGSVRIRVEIPDQV